jgi:hypothetical protein
VKRRETASLDVPIAVGAIAAGALLVVSLFFDWFEFSGGNASLSLSGWQALETSDALLFLIGIAAIVLAARHLRDPSPQGLPQVILLLGAVAVVIVLSLVIWDMPVVEIAKHGEGGGLQSDIQVGGWLALIGSVGLLIAGLVEATVRSVTAVEREPAPAEPPTRQL